MTLPNAKKINQSSIDKASDLVLASHNHELANYFYDLLEKKIHTDRTEEIYKDFLVNQQAFKDLVYDLNVGADRHWFGSDVSSDYQILHENLANRQIETMNSYFQAGKQSNFSMHCAFGEKSEFLRAYQIDNKKSDETFNNAMDQMVTTWLSKNHWMNKDGYICEVDEDTNAVKKDNTGNPVTADINKVRAAFYNEHTGFKSFMAQKDSKFANMDIVEQTIAPKAEEVLSTS